MTTQQQTPRVAEGTRSVFEETYQGLCYLQMREIILFQCKFSMSQYKDENCRQRFYGNNHCTPVRSIRSGLELSRLLLDNIFTPELLSEYKPEVTDDKLYQQNSLKHPLDVESSSSGSTHKILYSARSYSSFTKN